MQHDRKPDFVNLGNSLLNRCFKAFLGLANPKSCPNSCPLLLKSTKTICVNPYLARAYELLGDIGFEPMTSAV